jgi:predicted secreted hydrolase
VTAIMRRLTFSLTGVILLAVATVVAGAGPSYPDAPRDEPLAFPRDHGGHPAFRTEWWYVTGWLKTADGDDLGFQVTFFRSRPALDDANPSWFAPKQLLFAHAALADAKVGHLLHDQRIARAGFGIAESSDADAHVVLDGWRFDRIGAGDALEFHTTVAGAGFALDLDLSTAGPVLAQGADAGHAGWSQKGPKSEDASRYYSIPQLAVAGTVLREGKRLVVTGTAWLDREWSSAYLDPRASGWDWIGLNLDDGGALMAFRMRDRAGAKLWAGGARRFPDGRVERYRPADIDFATERRWTSPRSQTSWPVAQRVVVRGADPLTLVLDPLLDDQELDSRASTGTIYWEGAVRAYRKPDGGGERKSVGRGYLELTGYAGPLAF